MKLFVAGEVTADPRKWSSSGYTLIIAESVEKAAGMTADRPILEVQMDKPVILAVVPATPRF